MSGGHPRLLGLLWIVALAVIALGSALPARAVVVPPGFQARVLPIPRASEAPAPTYINGLRRPTTIDFAPDGKLFVGDWLGRVKVFDSVEDSSPTLAVDVATEVHSFGDRGLLGMKLDPQFGTAEHNYIYLDYAYDVPMGSAASPHAEFSDGGDTCKNEDPYTDCLISGRVVRVALNPATGVAAAGATEPPQQELVRSWCQQFNSHSMGDLEFDSSGALLVSGGEGANYSAADYGQFANPCGDPVNEGGSLRAQDVRTPSPADQTDYSGSIIRVDPATGDALPDNPLFKDPSNPGVDNPDVRARRLLAYGFRNPFRFEIRPGSSEVYVGDVGQSTWEELDRLTSPPAPGQAALDFGWPCYEGGNGANVVLASWQTLAEGGHAPPCQALYANPSLVTAPVWAYGHGDPAGRLFSGDACNPSPGAAYSGLVFYQPAGVPVSRVFPPEAQGALFMADAARGCIWMMGTNAEGKPDPSKISNFATSDEAGGISPVDLVQGPDGALYGPNFYNDSIEQIRYTAGNQPPTARISASKIDGPIGAGFTVDFNAAASTDPEAPAEDQMHFEWDLDGDGEFDDGADQATAQMTYSTAQNVTAKVRVRDEFTHSDIAQVMLYPGDLGPPAPMIEEPIEALDWAIGDTIPYKGNATDPDGDSVANGKLDLSWEFVIRHCPDACHTHPYESSETASGTLVAPPHEYPSHLRFELTATDSRGRAVTVSRDVFPRVVEIGLSSDPLGIPVSFDGEPASNGPFHLIAGGNGEVLAPLSASVGGTPYVFASWSDGGAFSHQITPLQDIDLVAHYVPQESGDGGGVVPPPTTVPPPIIVPPPLVPPAPPATARVELVSQPRGVWLRLGRARKKAPFSLRLQVGAATVAIAPATVTKAGRTLRFKQWKAGGKLVKGQRLPVRVRGNVRYVAVFQAG
jgi:glucose/arabinose dehydrogenase